MGVRPMNSFSDTKPKPTVNLTKWEPIAVDVVKCGDRYLFLNLRTWIEDDGFEGAAQNFSPDTNVDSIPWQEYEHNEMIHESLVQEIMSSNLPFGQSFVCAGTDDRRIMVARGEKTLSGPKDFSEMAEFYRVFQGDIAASMAAYSKSPRTFLPFPTTGGPDYWYDNENDKMYDELGHLLSDREMKRHGWKK